MTVAPFQDRPPESAHLTTYDERHLADYIRLLDADDEGADWREAVQIIFGLDPQREPQRARIVHDSPSLARPLDDREGLCLSAPAASSLNAVEPWSFSVAVVLPHPPKC